MALERDWKREKAICEAYLKGSTLGDIGDVHGITRERTRQILKRNDITSADSPRKDILAEKEKAEGRLTRRKQFLRQYEIIKSYGCRRIVIREMKRAFKDKGITGDPFGCYRTQRHNAMHRGIEWGIDFPGWWSAWEESGKWDNRGRVLGGYVMARFEDSGPYSKDNIYITTHSDNISAGYSFRESKRG